ncbi:hypothetical protein HZB74_01885 [Candidatus Saccharibacteria bacterium]|nr:hypothetical protein [Candidatus Saccharibacteria bacterium]
MGVSVVESIAYAVMPMHDRKSAISPDGPKNIFEKLGGRTAKWLGFPEAEQMEPNQVDHEKEVVIKL